MAKLKPYLNIGPGSFIKEEMEERGWSNEDLAQVLGLNPKTISELLNNKQRININTATLLSKAFNQSPQYWLNLENNYRLRLKENDLKISDVEIKSKIYERMPINDMVKKGWIKKPKNTEELTSIFTNFWDVSTLDFSFIDNLAFPNCRKSDAFESFNKYFLLAWTKKAQSVSEEISVSKYNKKGLNEIANDLSAYSVQKNGVSKFIADLNEVGVKFLCLSHLSKTYLDGAAFIHKNNPTIVYTKRYDRLDNFWFTIAHEIGHILLHVKNKNDVFIDNLNDESNLDVEKEANDFAASILKTKLILDYFEDIRHYISAYRVDAATRELNLNPSVIVGILKYYKYLTYNRLNDYKETIADKIPKKYFVEN
ncbi:MAG: HigA family addiction module antidote protein [Ignavibacteriae bacterium]|nr:HigA family addiction module antidote protein [Ignavibacteriota bacterium]